MEVQKLLPWCLESSEASARSQKWWEDEWLSGWCDPRRVDTVPRILDGLSNFEKFSLSPPLDSLRWDRSGRDRPLSPPLSCYTRTSRWFPRPWSGTTARRSTWKRIRLHFPPGRDDRIMIERKTEPGLRHCREKVAHERWSRSTVGNQEDLSCTFFLSSIIKATPSC